jgi:hypothetical protein
MLYARLSKLAHANPELRKHLVPLLRKYAGEAPMQEEGFEGKDEKAKGEKPKATPAAPAPGTGRKKKGPLPKWDEFLKAVYNGGKAKLPNPNPDPKIQVPGVICRQGGDEEVQGVDEGSGEGVWEGQASEG